jgi:hypothetical protein
MDAVRSRKLTSLAPIFLRGRTHSITTNLMPFGFECGPGWYNLLREVFDVAEKECHRLQKRGVHISNLPIAVQVKEKFGTLRLYADGTTDIIGEAIRLAEIASANTCESCGKQSQIDNQKRGWISNTCKACVEKRESEDKRLAIIADLRNKKHVLLLLDIASSISQVGIMTSVKRMSIIGDILKNGDYEIKNELINQLRLIKDKKLIKQIQYVRNKAHKKKLSSHYYLLKICKSFDKNTN